jgi:hypothetical protein
MPGLGPGIHAFAERSQKEAVDAGMRRHDVGGTIGMTLEEQPA